MASIVAVLSEMRREAQCDNSTVSSRDRRTIVSFLKQRAEALRDECRENICNNSSHTEFHGRERLPNINIMTHCGKIASSVEQFLKRT